MKKIELGIYKHYKGNYYLVLGTAVHTENLEELVVYQSLYGDFKTWVRPITMFLDETVEYQGAVRPRFARVADSADVEKFKEMHEHHRN